MTIDDRVPMSRFTTLGTGGPARWFDTPESEEALASGWIADRYGTRRTFLIFALAIAVTAVWGLRPLKRWVLAPVAIAETVASHSRLLGVHMFGRATPGEAVSRRA